MTSLLIELLELALSVAGIALAFRFFAMSRMPDLHAVVTRHRLQFLFALTFLVTAIKVGEEVLEKSTGPVDRGILLFLHSNVPATWEIIFQGITFSGSFNVLAPLTGVSVAALFFLRRRAEAVLLGSSVVAAALTIYFIKMAVGRERPALWQTETYWGSSFPSGHTLATAAFAMAAVICVGRIRPAARIPFACLAATWVALIGLSRMVLGVHWPTDVLAAMCLGISLPLMVRLAQAYWERNRL